MFYVLFVHEDYPEIKTLGFRSEAIARAVAVSFQQQPGFTTVIYLGDIGAPTPEVLRP